MDVVALLLIIHLTPDPDFAIAVQRRPVPADVARPKCPLGDVGAEGRDVVVVVVVADPDARPVRAADAHAAVGLGLAPARQRAEVRDLLVDPPLEDRIPPVAVALNRRRHDIVSGAACAG